MQRNSQLTAMTIVVALGLCASSGARPGEGPQGGLHRRPVRPDAGQLCADLRSLRLLCEGAQCPRRHRRRTRSALHSRRPARRDARRFGGARADHIRGCRKPLGNEPVAHPSRRLSDAVQRNRVPAVSMFSGIKEILPPKPLPYAFSAGHVFEVAGEVSGKLAAQLVKGKGKAICNSIESPGGVAVCQYIGRRGPGRRVADRHRPVSADRDGIRRHRPADGRHAAHDRGGACGLRPERRPDPRAARRRLRRPDPDGFARPQ